MKFSTAAAVSTLFVLPALVSGATIPNSQSGEAGRPSSNSFNAPKPPFGGFQPSPIQPSSKNGQSSSKGNQSNNAGKGSSTGTNQSNNAGKGSSTGTNQSNNAGKGSSTGTNQSNNAGKGAAASSSVAVVATSTAAVATAAASSVANSGDLQSSLALDPALLATGFEQNGQAVQEAGQVPSLTSSNNFINFCATTNLPITNGQQITTGSCNPAPMGIIASTANMPSSKFSFPANGATIPANQAFTVTMNLNNLEAGNFVNAQSNYYAAPQQVNAQGNIIGHTHFVIEQLDSLDQTTPTDPTKFAFFKGVNTPLQDGAVSTPVASGLPAGFYRLASINAAANHQPVLVAIAQHGTVDDMVYFTVSDSASNSTASAAAPAAPVATSSAAVPANSASTSTGGAKGTKGKTSSSKNQNKSGKKNRL